MSINITDMIIYLFALWGVIATLLIIFDITRDFRYNLKRSVIKKYRSKYRIGDVVTVNME